MSSIGRFFRKIIWSQRLFEFWQSLGVNVTKKHFYSPIPDTKELLQRPDFWTKPSQLPSINLNDDAQLDFLQNTITKYLPECDFPLERNECPYQYFLNNAAFGLQDAYVLHTMVRHFKPRKIIEIGSGNSTFVSARAALINQKEGHPLELISMEPYPKKILTQGFPGLTKQVQTFAQDIPFTEFQSLNENDILFIDSSHIVRPGSDVNFLFLEALPRLKKGVVVHIHDIYIPYEYPKHFIIEGLAFLNEQYLLQAFLCHNRDFEILFANHHIDRNHHESAQKVFKHPTGYRNRCHPNSFWIRKIN